jgi:excisionase family DNA binding protein
MSLQATLPPTSAAGFNPLRSPKDAARLLGVSVKTLNGFVRDGEIRYIDVGRGKKKIRRVFSDQDIDEFKERRARREVPCQSTSTKTARSTTMISNPNAVGFTALRDARTDVKPRLSKELSGKRRSEA